MMFSDFIKLNKFKWKFASVENCKNTFSEQDMTVHKETCLKCDLCWNSFTSFNTFKEHIDREHKQTSTGNDKETKLKTK